MCVFCFKFFFIYFRPLSFPPESVSPASLWVTSMESPGPSRPAGPSTSGPRSPGRLATHQGVAHGTQSHTENLRLSLHCINWWHIKKYRFQWLLAFFCFWNFLLIVCFSNSQSMSPGQPQVILGPIPDLLGKELGEMGAQGEPLVWTPMGKFDFRFCLFPS